MSKPEKTTDIKNSQSTTGINELMEIRNILFGENIASLEDKILTLGKRTDEQIKALRDEILKAISEKSGEDTQIFNAKLDELDRHVAQEIKQHANQIVHIEHELSDTQQQSDQTNAGIKEEIETLNQDLIDQLEQRCNALEQQLKSQSDLLDTQKMDRAALAQLFSQLANQLTQEPS